MRRSRLENSEGRSREKVRAKRRKAPSYKAKEDIEPILTSHNKMTIVKSAIAALIISIITELISLFLIHNIPGFIFLRFVVKTGIYLFAILNLTLRWKLYRVIIRYFGRISVIMIILTTLYGKTLNQGLTFGEYLTSSTAFLGLLWNLRFYILVYATYNLMLIITDNEKYAVLGTYFIVFSSYVQYNFIETTPIILGELLVVSSYNILLGIKSRLNAILLVVDVAFLTATFTLSALPFLLIFIALLIWIFVDKREEYIKYGLYITYLITVAISIIVALIVSRFYTTSYHFNSDINLVRNGVAFIYSYLNNFLLPFKSTSTNYLGRFGSFISVCPVPLIVSLMSLYKGEKHISFMLPLTLVTAFETIFCLIGFPDVLAKITHFDEVSYIVCAIAVNYATLLMAMYIISNVEEKMFSIKTAIRLTFIIIIILAFVDRFNDFEKLRYLYIFVAEQCALSFLFLNWTVRRYRNGFFTFMLLFVLIGGLLINPITGKYVETTYYDSETDETVTDMVMENSRETQLEVQR